MTTRRKRPVRGNSTERRFVVTAYDHDRRQWWTVDTWAKGISVADVRRRMSNRYPDLGPDDIKVTAAKRSGGTRVRKNGGVQAKLSLDEIAALSAYASRHGRGWRAKLLVARGKDTINNGDLHHAVNVLGPSGLRALKL